jgi:hypothetical protein
MQFNPEEFLDAPDEQSNAFDPEAFLDTPDEVSAKPVEFDAETFLGPEETASTPEPTLEQPKGAFSRFFDMFRRTKEGESTFEPVEDIGGTFQEVTKSGAENLVQGVKQLTFQEDTRPKPESTLEAGLRGAADPFRPLLGAAELVFAAPYSLFSGVTKPIERVTDVPAGLTDFVMPGTIAPRLSKLAKEAEAEKLLKSNTQAQLQDMGIDVSGLGKTGQEFTAANAKVAEALGAPEGVSKLQSDIASLTPTQQKVMQEFSLSTRAINTYTAGDQPDDLVPKMLSDIDKRLAKAEPGSDAYKQLQAEKTQILRDNKPNIPVNPSKDLLKSIDGDIAAAKLQGDDAKIKFLEAERAAILTKRELPEIDPVQFEEAIAKPVANAMEYGVPHDIIKAKLSEELTLANRSPDEISDLIEAAFEPYVTRTLKPEALDELRPASIPGQTKQLLPGLPAAKAKLVTKDELEKILKPVGVRSFVDDFAIQNRISRQFNRKNSEVYGDTENSLGDNTLNRVLAHRDNNHTVFTSWVSGDERGRVIDVANGVKSIRNDVKPLTKIYSDATKSGLNMEDAKLLHKAANAQSNIRKYKEAAAKIDLEIKDLNAQSKLAKTDQERAVLRSQIKTKSKEYADTLAQDTYKLDPANPMSAELQAKEVMDTLGQSKAGKQFLADMKNWSDNVLDMGVRGGLFTKEEAARMKAANQNYLSEIRKYDEVENSFGLVSPTKGTSRGTSKREGSTRELNVDPIESMVDYVSRMDRASNMAQERYHTLLHNLEHLDDDAFKLLFAQDKQKVIDALVQASTGKGDKIIDGSKLVTGEVTARPNYSVFLPSGQRLDLTVINTPYYEALVRPRTYTAESIGQKLSRDFASLVRNSATTWNPFIQPMFTIQGRMGYRANIPKDVKMNVLSGMNKSAVSQITKMAKDKDYYNYLKANISPGVLNRGLQGLSRIEITEKAAKTVNKQPGILRKTGVLQVKESLEEWAEFNEMIMRGKAYEDLKTYYTKQGKMTPEQIELAAIRGAKNLETNYFQQGAATNQGAYRWFLNSTPFLRTAINGGTKAVASLQHRPTAVAKAVLANAAIIHSFNVYNRQFVDESGTAYVDQIDPNQKQTHFFIAMPGAESTNDFVKVRLPFNFARLGGAAEQGITMALRSSAQYLIDNTEPMVEEFIENTPGLRQLMLEDNITPADLATLALNQITQDFDPTGRGIYGMAGLGPVAEVWTNSEDGVRPIVSAYQQNLPGYLQVNTARVSPLIMGTSQWAAERGFKGAMNNPTYWTYIAQNIAGNIGAYTLGAADMLHAAATGKELPSPSIKSMPGIGRFTLLNETSAEGIQSMYSNVYKDIAGLNREVETLRSKAKDGDTFAQQQYNKLIDEHPNELAFYEDILEPIQKELSGLYEEKSRLMGFTGERIVGKELTPQVEWTGDPKLREVITDIDNDIINLQRQVLIELKAQEKELGETYSNRIRKNPLTKGLISPFLDNKVDK